MAFYCYTSFLLQIHIVKHLAFSNLNGVCKLQKSVSKSTLSVIYMCYDTKISYSFHLFTMSAAYRIRLT